VVSRLSWARVSKTCLTATAMSLRPDNGYAGPNRVYDHAAGQGISWAIGCRGLRQQFLVQPQHAGGVLGAALAPANAMDP
jgi:hypothetical protein